MFPTRPQTWTKDIHDLITSIYIEANKPGGKPALLADQVAFARLVLRHILLDGVLRREYIEELRQVCAIVFRAPPPRRERPEEEGTSSEEIEKPIRTVLEMGPDEVHPDDLAVLLLNPHALSDVADLIDSTLPDWWLDRMEELGREWRKEVEDEEGSAEADPTNNLAEDELALSLMGLGKLSPTGKDCWQLTFEDEEARKLEGRIAEHLYGEKKEFELLLHRLSAGEGMLEFELEVNPAPVKEELRLTITFPAGEKRVFVVQVPPDARPRTRSEPCEPIAEKTFVLKGAAEWKDDAWPPQVMLKGAVLAWEPARLPVRGRMASVDERYHPGW